jgi:hypothetical protein
MLGATSGPRSQAASIVAGPSQTNLIATENTTVDSASVKLEATPAADAERENEAKTENQASTIATNRSRFRHSDPSPLDAARYQSQADQNNARQPK